jgi:hypothetical protein
VAVVLTLITNKNKYTKRKQYKNTVQTIQNTVNTRTHYQNTHTIVKSKHRRLLYWGGASEDQGEHSSQSAAKLKDNRNYTSIPPYAYMM